MQGYSLEGRIMVEHDPMKVKVEQTKDLFVYILTRDIAH